MIRFEHHRLTLNWYCYNFGLYYNCLIYCNIILILLFRSNTTDTPQLGQRPFKLTTLYCLLLFWLIGIYYWRTKCVDKIVIFDVTNVEAKMRFHRSLEWAKSSDAPTPFVDEVVCPPPLPWCYKIMWTAVRYLGAARKILKMVSIVKCLVQWCWRWS